MPDAAIQRLSKVQRLLSWESADADIPSWVFVDGLKIAGPIGEGETERSFTYSVNYTRTNAFEIVDAEEEPDPLDVVPGDRPTVKWKTAVNARSYKIDVDGSTDTIIKAVDQYIQTARVRRRLAAGWHKIEVIALDRYGNTTTSRAFWLDVYAPASPASAIGISAGSGAGLFDITVTP